jgi:hypothetical protein
MSQNAKDLLLALRFLMPRIDWPFLERAVVTNLLGLAFFGYRRRSFVSVAYSGIISLKRQYGLQSSHVLAEKFPTGCDFMSAPLGKKNCRYKQQVTLLDSQGDVIGGDVVMPNGGHIETSLMPGRVVTDVSIKWVKVQVRH